MIKDVSFRVTIRERARRVLLAADTLARDNIISGRDVEVPIEQMPVLLLYTSHEHKTLESEAGGAPLFNARCTLHVVARVACDTEEDAEAALDLFVTQIENALLTSPEFLFAPMRQVSAVAIDCRYDGKGAKPLGEAVMGFDCVYYDAYQPVDPPPLRKMAVKIDLGQPTDHQGLYDPANKPPRREGPDGRIEISGTIDLPGPREPRRGEHEH